MMTGDGRWGIDFGGLACPWPIAHGLVEHGRYIEIVVCNFFVAARPIR